MYVCICVPTTDRQVEKSIAEGCRTLREIRQKTGACSDCGRCASALRQTLRNSQVSPVSVLPSSNARRTPQGAADRELCPA